MSLLNPQSDDGRAWARVGVGLWLGLLLAIAVMTIHSPHSHSVVMHYMHASASFWSGKAIYAPQTSAGFLYLPAFAVAFGPFQALGSPAGDLMWRLVQAAVLTLALWRCAGRMAPLGRRSEMFGLALLLAVPGSAAALQNGQSTTLLAAATLLAFDAAYDRKPVSAAAWACLAVFAKPLGIIVWLLIAAIRLRAVPWLVAFLAIILAAPYAFQPASYVNGLYGQFLALMANIAPESANPAWNDFTAVPQALGLRVGPILGYSVRLAAAFATLAATWSLARERDYFRAALAPAALASGYMLLFNPRAELNTYLMMAASFGLAAALLLRRARSRQAGAILGAACLGLGLTGLATSTFNPWLNPLLLMTALTVLLVYLYRTKSAEAAARP